MKNKSIVMIYSMIRSGSTLLANIVTNTGEYRIASDILLPIFKSFNLEINRYKYNTENLNKPLRDGYFDKIYQNEINILDRSNFDISTSQQNLKLLKNYLYKYSYMTPQVKPLIEVLEEKNYKKIIENFLEFISKYKTNSLGVGFKEAYSESFLNTFNNTFEGTKTIFIIRNPFAISSSINNMNTNYPLLFILRNWRKNLASAIKSKFNSPDSTLILLYEDLVEMPEKISKNISKFLDVNYSKNMIASNSFRDLDNNKVLNNTSRISDSVDNKITKKNKNRWKEELNESQINFIYTFCLPELKKFYPDLIGIGEEVRDLDKKSIQDIFSFKQIPNWMPPKYFKESFQELFNEESLRLNYFQSGNKIKEDEIKSAFLNLETYKFLLDN